jgi:hypothetical protein
MARQGVDLNSSRRGKKVANKIKDFCGRNKIVRLLRTNKAKLRCSDNSAILWNLEKPRNSVASVRIQNAAVIIAALGLTGGKNGV